MVTAAQVEQALTKVMDPELGRSVIELKMLRDLHIHDHTVEFKLALTIPECPLRDQIAADAHAAVQALEGVEEVKVTLGAMTEEEKKAVFDGLSSQDTGPKASAYNHISRVVAIASGKGGVGKSSVTVLLAAALARAGHRVGVLDADVTGPSIPRLFGLRQAPLMNTIGLLPPETREGIKVMSVNLLLPTEDEVVIWRGPIISQVIQQFWNEVVWGDLDYLLVDLPPGTADAPLTVIKSLPLDGMVLVTSPQDLSAMVVRKALRMAEHMNVPVVGLVENMSGFVCTTCGTRHELFGASHTREIGELPLLARLSIAPQLAELANNGSLGTFRSEETDALAAAFMKAVPLAVHS